MYPKIIEAKGDNNYILIVKFDNKITKKYDVGKLLAHARFEPLKDKSLFRAVRIDAGGYGVSWNDGIDISEYELWVNGEE